MISHLNIQAFVPRQGEAYANRAAAAAAVRLFSPFGTKWVLGRDRAAAARAGRCRGVRRRKRP
ncbi:hypothetical protein MES4922_80143 [Mesorhizobium ventifaucium]|uniref:Uncharacterized protein n=1 Tax=Mesorhizobium ventifaucium TaxID=666020 RepID=A0ABN8KGD0_9HYPH|nr:hypothetical protein MES4922_80143 [Mesorhizobium ventifaucium]